MYVLISLLPLYMYHSFKPMLCLYTILTLKEDVVVVQDLLKTTDERGNALVLAVITAWNFL